VRVFADKVGEVAAAEAEQESAPAAPGPDERACLRLARGKTGPLFAFSAWAGGGTDGECRAACSRAGYRIGTAYQLADDLLDVVGREEAAGKTLGTDARLGKVTLPAVAPDGLERTRAQVHDLCEAARAVLSPWPGAQAAVADFLAFDLQPVFDRCLPGLVVSAGEPNVRHRGGRA
jgi:farnesyl diphosphate synthase